MSISGSWDGCANLGSYTWHSSTSRDLRPLTPERVEPKKEQSTYIIGSTRRSGAEAQAGASLSSATSAISRKVRLVPGVRNRCAARIKTYPLSHRIPVAETCQTARVAPRQGTLARLSSEMVEGRGTSLPTGLSVAVGRPTGGLRTLAPCAVHAAVWLAGYAVRLNPNSPHNFHACPLQGRWHFIGKAFSLRAMPACGCEGVSLLSLKLEIPRCSVILRCGNDPGCFIDICGLCFS